MVLCRIQIVGAWRNAPTICILLVNTKTKPIMASTLPQLLFLLLIFFCPLLETNVCWCYDWGAILLLSKGKIVYLLLSVFCFFFFFFLKLCQPWALWRIKRSRWNLAISCARLNAESRAFPRVMKHLLKNLMLCSHLVWWPLAYFESEEKKKKKPKGGERVTQLTKELF